MNIKVINFLSIVIIFGWSNMVFTQVFDKNSTDFNYPDSSKKYLVDDKGNILMHVNILGHLAQPGYHLIPEDSDIITLISIAGGYLPGANLKEVRIIREQADDNNQTIYVVNLKDFYKNGNKGNFVKIQPNDTIIIEENILSSVFRRSNTLNSILQILNIYLQISEK